MYEGQFGYNAQVLLTHWNAILICNFISRHTLQGIMTVRVPVRPFGGYDSSLGGG